MGFRTNKFQTNAETALLTSQQHLYNSPYEAMEAQFKLGSVFGELDPEFSTTGALVEMGQRALKKMQPSDAPMLSAEEANIKYKPSNPYQEPVRADIAAWDDRNRNKNNRLKDILSNVNPEATGSTIAPFIGAIAGGLTDPASLAMDIATGGLGTAASAGKFGVRAMRAAKMIGYGSKAKGLGKIAPTLMRNFVENLTPEAIIAMRNVQANENQELDDFILNLSAGTIAGSALELGIDFTTSKFKNNMEPPPIPPDQPVRDTGIPPVMEDTSFKYQSVEQMAKMNILTNDYLVDAGYKPVDMMLDYNHQTTQGLRDHVGNRHNRLGRDFVFEKRMNAEYARTLSKFTPDGIRDLGANPVDFYQPHFDNLTKKMDYISQRLEAAEKAEVARVEKAKTEAPTDEGYERRIKDFKYRNKIADFYDNMGGDINEMRNLQEAIFAQGKDLPPSMKKYLNEVEDAIRMFGGRSHEKLTKKPLDKVSIYKEAYDDIANSHLSKWGFDTKYKSVAEEAAEQGARVTTDVDLDRLTGELDRELSPEEILESIRGATEENTVFKEEFNEMREAHATRMKDLDAAHKELVESLKKEKYIDDIVDLMEKADLEADPAVKAELKETIAEYQEAMKDAMAPEEFRDVMDSLYDCIRG